MYEKEYIQILEQIDYLLDDDDYDITSFANLSALLNIHMTDINWVGFYFLKDSYLILGPFQGNPACTKIKVGNGVCGKTIEKKQTIIVKDVHNFEGHIACDARSRSEICIPIYQNDSIIGLLDIDSPIINRFNEIDRKYLEEIVFHLEKKLKYNKKK